MLEIGDIKIRPFEPADAESFVGAVRESVASVQPWMPWCHDQYSRADAVAWIASCSENLRESRAYDLGLYSTDGTEFIGGIGINQINFLHGIGSIGYWVRQSKQRQGFATRAVRLIASYGFAHLRLNRLEFVMAERNIASRRVAEKAGATLECVLANRFFPARGVAGCGHVLLNSSTEVAPVLGYCSHRVLDGLSGLRASSREA